MSKDLHDYLISEDDYLRRASGLVGQSDIGAAIQALEKARLHLPVSNRLLSALGRLYLTAKKPHKAAACFQEVLGEDDSSVEATDDDFEYLDEQADSLTETEYVYDDSPATTERQQRPTLSLARGRVESESGPKVVYRGRNTSVQDCSDALSEVDGAAEGANVNELLGSQSSKAAESGSSELVPATKSVTPQQEPAEADDEENDLELLMQENAEEDELDLLAEDGLVGEPHSENDLLLECGVGLDATKDSEELDLFDTWDDDLWDDDPEEADEATALDNKVDREHRALQFAVDCLEVVEWDKNRLNFLVEVFVSLGWSAAKRAIEREVLLGASYEELKVAFSVKQLWSECDKYWITFSKVWTQGEPTDAIYRNCSWKQALRLVRTFEGVPTFEEVSDFLDVEFDYWYFDRILTLRYPSFNHYLFSYRLKESSYFLPVSDTRRFDTPVAFDELNATYLSNNQSDEMKRLIEYGVDFASRHSVKNNYVSDLPLDADELNIKTKKSL
jgi:hypothetical protein